MSTLGDFMGDDDEGNCIGCKQPIDRITPDCPICLLALEAISDWSQKADGIDPDDPKWEPLWTA